MLCRGFLHHSQHIEAHQQARQGQQGEPGAEKQHHYNNDDRHGHAAGDVRDKQHGILLQLHHRGGEGGLDGAQALVGEVAHGGAFHLLADSQPVVPEDVEALGAHGDVLQPLEQETAEHAGNQDAEALSDHLGGEAVQMGDHHIDRHEHHGHGKGFQDVADNARIDVFFLVSGNIQNPFDGMEHSKAARKRWITVVDS